MAKLTIAKLAREVADPSGVYAYMTFRAGQENVPHTLPPEFYAAHLLQGVRAFFGIHTDDAGRVLCDGQQPRLWAAYAATCGLTAQPNSQSNTTVPEAG